LFAGWSLSKPQIHNIFAYTPDIYFMKNSLQEEKLFRMELAIYNKHRETLNQERSPDEIKTSLASLIHAYKKLMEQTRFLTWVSGRLERKLQRSNRNLQDRNKLLEEAIEELVTAKAGKSAYAIIYFIAIVLFVLEEFFIEPLIGVFGNGLGYSIMIKLGIVILLKISEGIIEDRIKKNHRGIRRSQLVEPSKENVKSR
jgi:hypothetical protein